MTQIAVIKRHAIDLTNYLVKSRNMDSKNAYAFLMSTRTFSIIRDVKFEIWAKPASYLIEKLEQELNGNLKLWAKRW